MGGSQSTRRIVVENQGGDGVVTVTEEVVRRLQGLPDEVKADKQEKARPPSTAARANTSQRSQYTQKEADSRMKDVEDFYNEKLKDLEARNSLLQKQTNEHFAAAVKEVEQKFMQFTASPVCQDLQSKVLECYRSNPKEPLNCSSLVNSFTACVDRARMAASASRIRNVSSS